MLFGSIQTTDISHTDAIAYFQFQLSVILSTPSAESSESSESSETETETPVRAMPIKNLDPIPMDSVVFGPAGPQGDWLWHGYLAAGDLTLLTSRWKSGKTTLISGLLQRLGTGEPFLNRATRPARVLYVSEEAERHWAERRAVFPIGNHVGLLSQPFFGAPDASDWRSLLDTASTIHAKKKIDLLVIDPLASFLPTGCEFDSTAMMAALHPLARLQQMGIGVLLLHHPRKAPAAVGSSARGSGALLGYVDTTLELERVGPSEEDANLRILHAQSRHRGTPARLTYGWNSETGEFTVATDPRARSFEENWRSVRAILESRAAPTTQKEISELWPEDSPKPSTTTLYGWLNRAMAKQYVSRTGEGNRWEPWRYRLRGNEEAFAKRVGSG